jgi:hypothetical protein
MDSDALRLAKARIAITAATRERERLLRELAKLKADNARLRLALRYARASDAHSPAAADRNGGVHGWRLPPVPKPYPRSGGLVGRCVIMSSLDPVPG